MVFHSARTEYLAMDREQQSPIDLYQMDIIHENELNSQLGECVYMMVAVQTCSLTFSGQLGKLQNGNNYFCF